MGYMVIEDYNLVDAFYMTIITVSTVGFKEVQPLSVEGRIFTSFLIIFSFGIFAYTVSYITRYIVNGDLQNYFKNYKVDAYIDRISDHVIVCGYGRNGAQAVKTLLAYGKECVIIENNDDILARLKEANLLYIKGDATAEKTLIRAGIKRAKSIISTLPNDAANVFVVLTARELATNIHIISRASEDSSEKKLRIAGSDNVIMPDKVGGAHMGSLVVTPDVYEFLDHISVMGSNEVNLEEIAYKNIPTQFHGKTLEELDKSYDSGCLIIGFRTPEGDYKVNPSRELVLVPGCKIFVLGTQSQIRQINTLFQI
ncbi:potassium channel protein [bacterium SCSIO 12643]|nr:potassium channel protein [bacterium SCSIO 12643]